MIFLVIWLVIVVSVLALLCVPGFIAYKRGLRYRWVILTIGVVGSFLPYIGLGSWIIALIMAVWPKPKA